MHANRDFGENKILYELSRGDEQAFTTLYNKYKNIVYSSALKITKSKILSEEVVQDVFLKIWQTKKELQDIADFESYLFIAGRNHIFNMLKKIAREEDFKKTIKNSDFAFNTTDSFLKDEQYTELLNRILLKLPPQQQRIYKMARIEGLSYQKIAEILNISPLTVKKHMAQALKLIRIELASHINILIVSFSYFFSQSI